MKCHLIYTSHISSTLQSHMSSSFCTGKLFSKGLLISVIILLPNDFSSLISKFTNKAYNFKISMRKICQILPLWLKWHFIEQHAFEKLWIKYTMSKYPSCEIHWNAFIIWFNVHVLLYSKEINRLQPFLLQGEWKTIHI